VFAADEEGDYSLRATLTDAKEAGCTIWTMAVTPHGTRMYAGTGDGRVLVYEIGDNFAFRLVGEIAVGDVDAAGVRRPVYSVALPPATAGHSCLLVAQSHGIYLYREAGAGAGGGWRVDAGVKAAHEGDVMSVKYVEGGRGVLSAGEEGKVRHWRYEIG